MRSKFSSISLLLAISLALAVSISSFSLLTLPKSVFETSQTISAGDSIDIQEIIESQSDYQVIQIGEKCVNNLSNSTIIESFEDKNATVIHLIRALNQSLKYDELGYSGRLMTAFSNGSDITQYDVEIFKRNAFFEFYHNLFRNKDAREMLFNEGLDVLYSFCERYPKDFRKHIIYSLKDAETFALALDTFHINEEESYYWENYLRGFIYRRYKADGVPQKEIIERIRLAKARISSISPTTLPDAMHEIVINDQIKLLYTDNENSITSLSTGKNVVLSPSQIDYITYYESDGGYFYEVSGTAWNSEGEGFGFRNLYDLNLEIVN